MVFHDWKEAVHVLEDEVRAATPRQLALAELIALRMSRRLPARVAAVLLREALRQELLEPEPGTATLGQLEYLRDLETQTGVSRSRQVRTRAQAAAWISVLHSQRAINALRTLMIRVGDVVAAIDAADRDSDEVASISADGRVNFRGGRGAGARPHHLRVVARREDDSAAAREARERAATRRALRVRLDGPPTAERLAALQPDRVTEGSDDADLLRLRDVIDTARDERPLQRLLTEVPALLATLTVSSFGTFVRPLPRLGSAYVPDFVIAVADSGGIHYTLVELESPLAKIALRDGGLAAKAREAVGQVESWREWLKDNLAYAQRAQASGGLGLPEIRPEAPGLILIGRRTAASSASRVVRQRLRERQGVEIHSYDWLAEAQTSRARATRALGAIDTSEDWAEWNPFADIDDDPAAFAPFGR